MKFSRLQRQIISVVTNFARVIWLLSTGDKVELLLCTRLSLALEELREIADSLSLLLLVTEELHSSCLALSMLRVPI